MGDNPSNGYNRWGNEHRLFGKDPNGNVAMLLVLGKPWDIGHGFQSMPEKIRAAFRGKTAKEMCKEGIS
jgi:hypothetical protein